MHSRGKVWKRAETMEDQEGGGAQPGVGPLGLDEPYRN
jgi:hypothetical protein